MLVFIDESGDPGFRTDRGATPIFVAAMVLFGDSTAADSAAQTIHAAAERLRVSPEFKFNKCRPAARDGFFQAVAACNFRVRAIVIRKDVIYSPRLKADKERFYQYFVRQMMLHDNGRLRDAKVRIDGSGDREFRRSLNVSLRRRLDAGAVRDVRFVDSRRDPLVQLADMAAGAIARSYRRDRADAGRWRAMLGPKIDDVWEFQ